MFDFLKKKPKQQNEVEKLIELSGVDTATEMLASMLSDKLPTRELAYQFILEELEAASMGNQAAINFSVESGISPSEYEGAMNRSCPEVDGPDGPQQLLIVTSGQLHSNPDLMIEFRTKTVDKVMKQFNFGRYEYKEVKIEQDQPVPKTNDHRVLFINESSVEINGPVFEFQVELGDVRTSKVSVDRETGDLFIQLTRVRDLIKRWEESDGTLILKEPEITKPDDIVEVKPQLGDISIFTHGLYRVGALDGNVAPLILLQTLGPDLTAASDNPLNIQPEEAHDVFSTLRILSDGNGLQLEQIAPEYTMLYDILWPGFSRNLYPESYHGYKLAKEFRARSYEMVINIADSAYLELDYNKSFSDLNDGELKQLYVLAGYKLIRIIYDKTPDDHPVKQAH